jgi:hypothetical protein
MVNLEFLCDEFLCVFRVALNRVPDYYYGRDCPDKSLNTWVPQDHSEREALRKYLSRYGERVFCYELYHQIRSLIDSCVNQNNADVSSRICLQAELKKDCVRHIIKYFPKIRKALAREYIPDFLLHSPEAGNVDFQGLIIEVKSDPGLSFSDIKKDLIKLQEFLAKYGYQQGVFLTVNSSAAYSECHCYA